jgi:putative transcriptional regulator
MAKKLFDDIKAGLEDAIAIAKGAADPAAYRVYVPSSIDVRAIRKRYGLSQAQFADRFGFTLGAIRDWEQNRRTPEGPTRAYFVVIDREPDAVLRALSARVEAAE